MNLALLEFNILQQFVMLLPPLLNHIILQLEQVHKLPYPLLDYLTVV